MALDLGAYCVTVNAIAPGMVETDMMRALPEDVKERFVSEIVMGTMGQRADVAEFVVLVSSDKPRHLSGEDTKVDGWQYI